MSADFIETFFIIICSLFLLLWLLLFIRWRPGK